jgi:flagellar hook-basal body complex protein FliE
MTRPIDIQEVSRSLEPQLLPLRRAAASGGDFKQMLLQSLEEVNQLRQEAHGGVERVLTGQEDNVAEVMAAVKKAGVAFDLLMEMRNKLLDAYQEIRQMHT